jgi:hypothetical protein
VKVGIAYARRPIIRLDAGRTSTDTTKATSAISQLLPIREAGVTQLKRLLCLPEPQVMSDKPDGFVKVWMIDRPDDLLSKQPKPPLRTDAEAADHRRTLMWGMSMAFASTRADVEAFKKWKSAHGDTRAIAS